jgi:hypothetical protein
MGDYALTESSSAAIWTTTSLPMTIQSTSGRAELCLQHARIVTHTGS